MKGKSFCMMLSLSILSACSNAPVERQQYFDAASGAERQWQQTVYHTTQFYGCGDNNFPCVPETSIRSTTPVRSDIDYGS